MFRYPGSKAKILPFIVNALMEHQGRRYCEPFFGGGSVLFGVNQLFSHVRLNDKDVGTAKFWTAIMRQPDDLARKVQTYTPRVEDFYTFKDELLKCSQSDDTLDIAFKKLVIHQISYSGLGTMSGGPLGGQEQKSKYKIDCRWSPHHITKKIYQFAQLFSRLTVQYNECTALDFEDVMNEQGDCCYYLDPPYYEQGNKLYQCGFTNEDHVRLARILDPMSYWVLSYDDNLFITTLYIQKSIYRVRAVYSIVSKKNNSKVELLITPC